MHCVAYANFARDDNALVVRTEAARNVTAGNETGVGPSSAGTGITCGTRAGRRHAMLGSRWLLGDFFKETNMKSEVIPT